MKTYHIGTFVTWRIVVSLLCIPSVSLDAAETRLIFLHIEPATYPLKAKVSKTEGVVVLRVSSPPGSGRPKDIEVIDGPKDLVSGAVENLKLWKIDCGACSSYVMVYRFSFSGLCYEPCKSNFEFHRPNFIAVTTGVPIVMQ